jgi:type III pantothenate kinase
MTSLLAVDAGNSTTKVGWFKGTALKFHLVFPTASSSQVRIQAVLDNAIGRIRKRGDPLPEIAVCSVVPAATRAWVKAARRARTRALVIRGETPAPIGNAYRQRKNLGPDRLATAVAAAALHRPVIAVNFGTATTVDAVSADGRFLGGAICLGIGMALESLSRATALLPGVAPRKPSGPIGRNTRACLLAGAYHGTIGQVNEIVKRQRVVLGDAPVVVTGGHARLVAREIVGCIAVRPRLTLEGIRLIWLQNRKEDRA